jgi:class 3 adenylate cyclase
VRGLSHIARAGSVVVDGALRDALGEAFRSSRLPPVRVRGVPERVVVFRVRRQGEEP